jgi:hypothetical protein
MLMCAASQVHILISQDLLHKLILRALSGSVLSHYVKTSANHTIYTFAFSSLAEPWISFHFQRMKYHPTP